MTSIETLRRRLAVNRSTAAVLVGVAAFALTLALPYLFFHGVLFVEGTPGGAEPPHASFRFAETNVTVADGEGTTERTAVAIAHRSGADLPQGTVAVTVNGETAWDVRATEAGPNASVAPWNETGAAVSESPARIVVYGDDLGEMALDDADGEYAYLREGDVVGVVWYDPDGDRMTVLQRYTVRGSGADGSAG